MSKILEEGKFPPVPEDYSRRKLYFYEITEAEIEILRQRRYDPIVITTMPVETPEERRSQLQAINQGLADGTVFLLPQQIKGLELAMRAHQMLSDKFKADAPKTSDPKTVKALIGQLSDSHGKTLYGSSTVTDVNTMLDKLGRGGEVKQLRGKLQNTKKVERGQDERSDKEGTPSSTSKDNGES